MAVGFPVVQDLESEARASNGEHRYAPEQAHCLERIFFAIPGLAARRSAGGQNQNLLP